MEVEGATVSTGLVNVFSSTGSGVQGYVVQDRATATKWKIQISDGQITWVATSDSTSSEPIMLDTLTPGTYWKLFISNGQMGWESTVTVQNDSVVLQDLVDGQDKLLLFYDGQLGSSVQTTTTETFNFDDNDVRVGEVNFTTIAGITVSGITDGVIRIRSLNEMGQPINQKLSIGTNVPVRFYIKNGRVIVTPPGQDYVPQIKMMAEPDLNLEPNDVVYVLSGLTGMTIGKTDLVRKIWDFDGVTHHTECNLVEV